MTSANQAKQENRTHMAHRYLGEGNEFVLGAIGTAILPSKSPGSPEAPLRGFCVFRLRVDQYLATLTMDDWAKLYHLAMERSPPWNFQPEAQ